MKYMGHKGKLLPVLGEILKHEGREARRIADPFCGSGAVSWFLAQHTGKEVLSGDLQSFAVARAAAVIERTAPVDPVPLLSTWFIAARRVVDEVTAHFPNAAASIEPTYVTSEEIREIVARSRRFCDKVLPGVCNRVSVVSPITKDYGGHYFSPLHAIALDALRQTLPQDVSQRSVAIAALIEAASRCAAAPGHTAQPFQPTDTAAPFIIEAWNRDVWASVEQAVQSISVQHARVQGTARAVDYAHCIDGMEEGDLVFADPPYTDVHYSRFYHVLETLARGTEVDVTGVGRYPPLTQRPPSSFSRRGEAKQAAATLLSKCGEKRVNLVLTFPTGNAGNGLSTADFIEHGRKHYRSIEIHNVDSTFSTLGGSARTRGGRKVYSESIVCFRI